MTATIHHGILPGAIGRITELHGAYYSALIDGSPAAAGGAHLRWFITSEQIRGAGIGTSLLSSALAFAQARRYARIFLWTFEGLDAARQLYEKAGFRLIQQRSGSQRGITVNEQCFELRAYGTEA